MKLGDSGFAGLVGTANTDTVTECHYKTWTNINQSYLLT